MGDAQGLAAAADLLEGFAVECEAKEQLQQSLSLRLLALQLLLLLLKDSTTLDTASKTSDTANSGSDKLSAPDIAEEADQHSSVKRSAQAQQADVPRAASASRKQAKHMLANMYTKIQETVQVLRKDNESQSLPYCWQVVYELALDLARTGAMQEIIGKLDSAHMPYSQVL